MPGTRFSLVLFSLVAAGNSSSLTLFFKLKRGSERLYLGLCGTSASFRDEAFADISRHFELVNEGLAPSVLGQHHTIFADGSA